MVRKKIPTATETAVLLSSRRRCALCFGLNRDGDIKLGQVAHIDRNPANNDKENLVFLCFNHHDEYDSRPSQRKGISPAELKAYRQELRHSLGSAFSQPVHFGSVILPASDPYAGTYVRMGALSAELVLTPLPETYEAQIRYFVTGTALWGEHRPYGPNLGLLEFQGTMLRPSVIQYEEERRGQTWKILLEWASEGNLYVTEDNWVGQYGMNVNFIGTYKRVT